MLTLRLSLHVLLHRATRVREPQAHWVYGKVVRESQGSHLGDMTPILTLRLPLHVLLHRATRVSELEAEVFTYRQQLQHMADIQQVRGGRGHWCWERRFFEPGNSCSTWQTLSR